MKKIYTIPLQNNFIDELTSFIFNNESRKNDYSRIAVVFPNKRAFLYLNKKFAEKIKAPFISFKEFTIDNFINYLAEKLKPDFKTIEPLEAVYYIWQISNKNNLKFSSRTFSDFLEWGFKIFEFIEEIDMEDVPSDKLENIQKNAEIGYDIPCKINELLKNIKIIREEFHKFLEEKKSLVRGYNYLIASQKIDELKLEEFEKIYFAGIFALTNTELKIINHLWSKGKAIIVINGTPEDSKIIAELFNKLGKPEISPLSKNQSLNEPEIKFFSAPDTHLEVLSSLKILNKNIKNTVVVLPLSETLHPFLNLVLNRLINQKIVKDFNIALSYPINKTALFLLLKKILQIQKFPQKKENGTYNKKLYAEIISNPFIKNIKLIPDQPEEFARDYINEILKMFSGEIKKENQTSSDYYKDDSTNKNPEEQQDFQYSTFIKLADIEKNILLRKPPHPDYTLYPEKIIELHNKIFRNFEKIETLSQLAEKVEELLTYIKDNTNVRSYIFSGEIFNKIFSATSLIKRLEFANEKFDNDEETGKNTIFDIFLFYLDKLSLTFDTQPLKDFEIMGMLETRNLNFENLLILDFQEKVIPEIKDYDSLIPNHIRNFLELPDNKKRKEIYNYYFNRLLKSSKNIYLFFVENDEKEKSRFIEDLVWEKEKNILKKFKNNENELENSIGKIVPIEQIAKTIKFKFIQLPDNKIEIQKTSNMLKDLNSIDVTALDTYLNCGVKFYLKNILKLKPCSEITDEFEAKDIGSIIHKILCKTYEKVSKTKMDFNSSRIDELNKTLENSVDTEFDKYLKQFLPLQSFLIKEITKKKLKDFIKKDLEKKFEIHALEKEIQIQHNTNGKTITLKGKIDRINKIGENFEKFEIIDYKTGSDTNGLVAKLEELQVFNIETSQELKSIQLPVYVKLFIEDEKKPLENITAKYIFLRKNCEEIEIFKDPNSKNKKNYNQDLKKQIFDKYMEIMENIINDIFDLNKPFKSYEKTDCKYCEFFVENKCIAKFIENQ